MVYRLDRPGALCFFLSLHQKSFFSHYKRFIFWNCYNLVYLSWYLGLYPLDWLGFSAWQGWLLAYSALFIVSFHQGLIISIFLAACLSYSSQRFIYHR